MFSVNLRRNGGGGEGGGGLQRWPAKMQMFLTTESNFGPVPDLTAKPTRLCRSFSRHRRPCADNMHDPSRSHGPVTAPGSAPSPVGCSTHIIITHAHCHRQPKLLLSHTWKKKRSWYPPHSDSAPVLVNLLLHFFTFTAPHSTSN